MCLIMFCVVVKDFKVYGILFGVVIVVNGGIVGGDVLFGGYLVINYGFVLIFWIMVGVVIVVVLVVWFFVLEMMVDDCLWMDWWGVFLFVVLVGLMFVVVNELGKLVEVDVFFVVVFVVVVVVFFFVFWKFEGVIFDLLVLMM